jgi:hypothetical protein
MLNTVLQRRCEAYSHIFVMVLNKDDTVATDDHHNTPLDGIFSLQIGIMF